MVTTVLLMLELHLLKMFHYLHSRMSFDTVVGMEGGKKKMRKAKLRSGQRRAPRSSPQSV